MRLCRWAIEIRKLSYKRQCKRMGEFRRIEGEFMIPRREHIIHASHSTDMRTRISTLLGYIICALVFRDLFFFFT